MKTEYKHFTAAQREQARQTDLVAFLQSRGENLKRSGREYEWRDGAQKVSLRGNLWFHQYERIGGDAVDFVEKFYGLSYPQAVTLLLEGNIGVTPSAASQSVEKEVKAFALPPSNHSMRRVYAYLMRYRGIDRDVLDTFVRHGMIYESSDFHNAVFVGFDTNKKPCHAHKRGTGSGSSFKGNAAASNPRYSFHWNGNSDRLYLFESPVDLLSFVSLYKDGWEKHSYAAACCVGDQVLFQTLADHPNITKVYLCMDNDEAGQAANLRIAEKLRGQDIYAEILIPRRKDWNEDLMQLEEREETQCKLSY